MATSDGDGAARLADGADAWAVKACTDDDLAALIRGTRCNTCMAAAAAIADRVKALVQASKPLARTPDQWELMAIMPGVTVNKPAAVQEVQRGTHDRLLAVVGDKACGPVYWRHFHGAAEIRQALATVIPDDPAPDVIAAVDQSEALLKQHGDDAVLVVAMVEVSE